MASNSIGRASIFLGVTDKITGGLNKAYGSVQAWKNKATNLIQGGWTKYVGGNLFADALKTADSLAAVGRQAKALGVASDQFMGLAKAAKIGGMETEQFYGFMSKMTANLSKGGPDVAAALNKVGLSINDIKDQSPDQQFIKISDALYRTADGGKRAELAQELFGKKFAQVLPIIDKSKGSLQGFIDKQVKLGTALKPVDMEKVMRVKESMPKVQAVFEGAWNKCVVALSPILSGIGERLSKLVENATPFIDLLVHGFETFWTLADGVLGEVFQWCDEITQTVAEWFGYSLDTGKAFDTVDTIVRSVYKTLAGVYLYTRQTFMSFLAIGATIAGTILEGLEDIKKELADIVEVGSRFGMFGGLVLLFGDGAAGKLRTTNFKKIGQEMQQWAGEAWTGWDKI